MTRFVVDEASLGTFTADDDNLSERLWTLGDLLLHLRSTGEEPSVLSSWASTLLSDGQDFGQFLYNVPAEARDEAVRVASLLGKCSNWDDDVAAYVEPEVHVDGRAIASYGLAHAREMVLAGSPAGCVVVLYSNERGSRSVASSSGDSPAEVVVVAQVGDEVEVYRQCLLVEAANEHSFFEWTERAFPRLVFAESVTFRRFRGTYDELKLDVVTHLSRLNDLFLEAYIEERSHLDVVSTRLGISISNEGSYRGSQRLMRQRDVTHSGETFRCEMHSKIRPDRNRIHFCILDSVSGERRILIGIFAEHLETSG